MQALLEAIRRAGSGDGLPALGRRICIVLSFLGLAALSCSALAESQRVDALGPEVHDTNKPLDSVKGHYWEY